MTKQMYNVVCEWDVAQDNLIFETEDDAWDWIEKNPIIQEVLEDNGGTLEELIDEGLVDVLTLEVYSKES